MSNKGLEPSRNVHRLMITSNENFTIPDTASLICLGGGIFKNGIAIGNNNSIIPGSIRYNNNKLQYKKLEDWVNISESFVNNCKEHSIAKFGSDGELKDTNISIENNDITGIDLLETEYITTLDNVDLKITTSNKINMSNNNGQNINFLSDPPLNSKSVGSKGDYAWDKDYIYMCIDENEWKRTQLKTW
jgi:hypothetical protein